MASVLAHQDIDEARPRASRLQSDLAARILRTLKARGAGPGHHLVELDLCREFDVSRTPVPGALRLLAEQGAVEARANRGYVLKGAITEAACLIESTFELDREWLDPIRAQNLAFRKRKWRDTLSFELFEINADFHEGLARCSGNRYFLDAVQRQYRLRSFLNIQWLNGADACRIRSTSIWRSWICWTGARMRKPAR